MKIQKVPRGLLELFKLRQTGEYPDDFGKGVVPVVDCGAFYASDTLISAGSAPTVGALAPELVEDLVATGGPLGVVSLGGILTIGAAAATNINFSWGILLPGLTRIQLGCHFVAQAGAAAVVRVGSTFPRIVVPNGTTLFVEASGTAAGVDHSLAITGLLENLVGSAG